MSLLNMLFSREPSDVDGIYYNKTTALAGGVVNQEVDLASALATAGRTKTGPARYLVISSDVAITFRCNDTTLDAVAVSAGGSVTIPLNVLVISKLYLTHGGACGAAAASVKIFAA